MNRFREEHKDDFIDHLREFEVKKRTVQPEMESKITFRIPITLHELYRDVCMGEIRDAVRKKQDLSGKVTFAGDKMRVDADVVKSLFSDTNKKITNHIKSIFDDQAVKGISAILMVGGFSESPMLRDAVQKTFPSVRVIIPHEAGLAVLKGAVIFGHNSSVTTSRIAKYTYGMKCYKPFNPSIHPRERRVIKKDGEQTGRGFFDKLVEIGQAISPEEPTIGKSYSPTGGQSGFRIKLYASPRKDLLFVDEPDCIRIGDVTVSCLDKEGRIGCATVHLIFGGTELEVTAVHNTTGEQTRAFFDFLE